MSSSRGKKVAVPSSKRRRGSGSAKVRHPFLEFPQALQEELFQRLCARPITIGHYIDWAAVEQVQLADAICALLSTDPWELFFTITKPIYLELTLELCSSFHLQVVMTNNDDPGTIHFRLGGLVCSMSVPEFGVALGLYTDDFMEEKDMNALPHNIYISPSLSYFTAFVIRHQTERHWKGVISIGPYVMRLARHFGLLNTAAQSLALTLIGQMSPQGITTMLHMRMIERQRGTDPPQYRLSHVIDKEDLEDIPDDVPPQHEKPSTAPPRE
ncbi:hypothetical protein GOBAR_AA00135 [Gossypium barbadense]|uniref:Uncharacterized protein n=1 Tax=Gossypium barbadense TaxID=3634 RepID=A0A2P5YXX6_GOSBA|nr:hypothetical protein GOBAR_AA00135 [Gossypium barbadense]